MPVYSPTRRAVAFVHWGRWIADCPAGCRNAEGLVPGQDAFTCSHCGQIALITWPPDVAGIWQALAERPREINRNWFPRDHPLALRSGQPHGQTPADLRAETLAHSSDTKD